MSSDSDSPQVGSARSDSTGVIKVNRRKTNRRKTRPSCIFLQSAGKFLSYTRLHFLLRIKTHTVTSYLRLFASQTNATLNPLRLIRYTYIFVAVH